MNMHHNVDIRRRYIYTCILIYTTHHAVDLPGPFTNHRDALKVSNIFYIPPSRKKIIIIIYNVCKKIANTPDRE